MIKLSGKKKPSPKRKADSCKTTKKKSSKARKSKAIVKKKTKSQACTSSKNGKTAKKTPPKQAPTPSRPTPLVPTGGQNAPQGVPPTQVAPPIVPGPSLPEIPVAAPPPVDAPAPTPETSAIPVYAGTFGPAEAARLLWRAGFGPAPGQAQTVAAMGLERAVLHLTRPSGPANLVGPEPRCNDGSPLEPYDISGHDHTYWLDRMIRTDQPLVERMALVFHDWFACSVAGVESLRWAVDQTNLFRLHALGSFKDLVRDVTADPAMIKWLDGFRNHKNGVNENYAREVMELFTLGVDRGAYTEADVRDLARSLTGWTGIDSQMGYYTGFVYDVDNHDSTLKTVFGQTGNYDWTDVCRMVVDHPLHPSFFVAKLWGYFIPVPPSESQRAALERLYVSSQFAIRPVLEAILMSDAFYTSQRMVKPPVVYNAGLMRIQQRFVTHEGWYWYSTQAGQRLYWPPDVSGWNDKRWLDTNTVRARWDLATQTFIGQGFGGDAAASYSATETPDGALARALAFWGNPEMSTNTVAELKAFAARVGGTSQRNAERQNVLRQIVPCTPDYLTS